MIGTIKSILMWNFLSLFTKVSTRVKSTQHRHKAGCCCWQVQVNAVWIFSQFSHSVMSNSLRRHGLQLARLPCPSPTPRAYSNSCAERWWCHPTISSSVVPFSSCLKSFPSLRVFYSESVLRIRWPKYWSCSFSISPSNEYSGLISFRMGWLNF